MLLFTERYHDYSLPGGGLDEGEDVIAGMVRELEEETGAQNIHSIKPFGIYEEFRPWYKDDADVMHMISYCYSCKVDRELGATAYEDYEVKNGMKAVWINIHEAIALMKRPWQKAKKRDEHRKGNLLATLDRKRNAIEFKGLHNEIDD